MRINSQRYIIAIVISAVWVFLMFDPVINLDSISDWFGRFSTTFFSSICHQQWNRTFLINDLPMAVCVRCTGIYLGIATTLVMIPLLPDSIKAYQKWMFHVLVAVFLLNIAENVIDFAINPETQLFRFVAGFSFGIICCLIFNEIFYENNNKTSAYGTDR